MHFNNKKTNSRFDPTWARSNENLCQDHDKKDIKSLNYSYLFQNVQTKLDIENYTILW